MNILSPAWSLHPQLERDTTPLGDLPLSRVVVINDANYPWLLLVPRRYGAVELIDLDEVARAQLMTEIAMVSGALKEVTECDKLNVAALGNAVPQLHVHVIARRKTDKAWPKPIWGVVPAIPHDAKELDRFMDAMKKSFGFPETPKPQQMPFPIDLGSKPRLAYANSPLERAAEKRDDETALASLRQTHTCLHYIVGGEWVVLKKNGGGFDPAFSLSEVEILTRDAQCLFLGLQGEAARFGIGLDPKFAESLKEREGYFVTDLRSIAVQGLVAFEHLPALAETKALLHWHARHRFCANCGAPSNISQGGWRRDCPQCQAQHFPRTDPVAIMLAFDGDRCLLGRSARFVPNSYSCLAGFVEPGESIEEAVRRETLEEAGIRCGRVRYFASQPWPFPTSLMIGCHAQAISRDITIDRNELEDARWFSREETATMLLRQHPQGLITPPPSAIAHHIIRAWVEDGDRVLD